jgi:hypothetical protein
MTDRLQAELLETKNELLRLIERMSLGAPVVHKDMSLISLMPKWSGVDSAVSLEEFFTSIEVSAKMRRCDEGDKREITVLRLRGTAKVFHQGCAELHEEGATCQTFKDAFRRRYKGVQSDQYHFTKLQTERQARN